VTDSSPPPTGVEQRLDTIIHLLTAIITKDMSRKDAVLMLTSAGLSPIAVAGLLGLKQNQVNVVLYDARQAAKTTPKAAKKS
jgi:hypothetical protein